MECPLKVVFSGPNVCNVSCYHENRNVTSKIISPQKVAFSRHSMFMMCSNYYNWVKI